MTDTHCFCKLILKLSHMGKFCDASAVWLSIKREQSCKLDLEDRLFLFQNELMSSFWILHHFVIIFFSIFFFIIQNNS